MLTRKPLRAAATATRVDQSNHALSRDPATCGVPALKLGPGLTDLTTFALTRKFLLHY